MAEGVYVPIWGLQMEEATVAQWIKQEGDQVSADEPLVVIETFKIAGEVASPVSGVLKRQMAGVGQVLKVGALLAVVGEAGEPDAAVDKFIQEKSFVTDLEVSEPGLPSSKPAQPSTGEPRPSAPAVSAGGPLRATPLARKMAREHGLDLRSVAGSGGKGRIYARDVEDALKRTASESALESRPEDRVMPLSSLRRAIVSKTMQTVDIPYGALSRTVQVDALLDFRHNLAESFEKRHGLKLSLTHLIFKAVALALTETPILNASLSKDAIVIHGSKNIGMVVTPPGGGGIMIPVLKDVQGKSLARIAREWKEMVGRIQAGTQTMEDLSGGTFTVSNVGALGIDVFTPLIHPPESAILGISRVVDAPVVKDGAVVVGRTLSLIVGADHRVFDADPIGEFLTAMDRLFQNPAEILL